MSQKIKMKDEDENEDEKKITKSTKQYFCN